MTRRAPLLPATATRGFTLVEAAVVMIIVGLLIGGVMQGRVMYRNAQLTATITEARSYLIASKTFRDTYESFAGDLAQAGSRLPGCGDFCTPADATADNNIVGRPNWGTGNWASQYQSIQATAATAVEAETILFFWHLNYAGLTKGVSPTTLQTTGAWGRTHPSAAIRGGWLAGYADKSTLPGLPAGAPADSSFPLSGNVIALALTPGAVSDPTSGTLGTTPGMQVLTAQEAFYIDSKMDDGKPATGDVQAYGETTSCFTDTASMAYNLPTPGRDCGLMFRLK